MSLSLQEVFSLKFLTIFDRHRTCSIASSSKSSGLVRILVYINIVSFYSQNFMFLDLYSRNFMNIFQLQSKVVTQKVLRKYNKGSLRYIEGICVYIKRVSGIQHPTSV